MGFSPSYLFILVLHMKQKRKSKHSRLKHSIFLISLLMVFSLVITFSILDISDSDEQSVPNISEQVDYSFPNYTLNFINCSPDDPYQYNYSVELDGAVVSEYCVTYSFKDDTAQIETVTSANTEPIVFITADSVEHSGINYEKIAVGKAFMNKNGDKINLKSLCLSSAVSSVNGSAFYKQTSLKSVYIDEGLVELIGSGTNAYTFRECTGLEYLHLPDSLTTIGARAFITCTSLTHIEFGTNSSSTNLDKISEGAFDSCTSLTSIILPEKLTDVGTGTFAVCKSLESVEFKSSNELTLNSAFRGTSSSAACPALKTVIFNDNVKLTLKGEFRDAISLESITLPANITSINSNTFKGCTSLKSINIADADQNSAYISENGMVLEKMEDGYNLLICPEGLKEITIPQKVTSIDGLFKNRSTISKVTFDSVSLVIKDDEFLNCTSLTDVVFNNCTITSIGANAFCETGIYTITIPDSVQSIGENAFKNCRSLTTVYINESSRLNSIGDHVFYGCSYLDLFHIPASVESLGTDVFYGCTSMSKLSVSENNDMYDLQTGLLIEKQKSNSDSKIIYVLSTVSEITIPEAVTGYTANAFLSNTISKISVNESNITYSSKDGYLMSADETKLLFVGGGVKDLCLTDSISLILSDAFKYAASLTSISWTGTSLEIESNAVSGLQYLKTVSLSATGNITLNSHSINSCSSVESIIIDAGKLSLNTLSATDTVFYGCGYDNLTISLQYDEILLDDSGGYAISYCYGLNSLNVSDDSLKGKILGKYNGIKINVFDKIENKFKENNPVSFILGISNEITSEINDFNYSITSITKTSTGGSFEFSFTTADGRTCYDVELSNVLSYDIKNGAFLIDVSKIVSDSENIVVIEKTGTKDITVSFDVGSGSSVESIYIISGTTILPGEMPAISLDGYQFSGWYLDSNYSTIYKQTPIYSDITLHARWIPLAGVELNFSSASGVITIIHDIDGESYQIMDRDKLVAGETFIANFDAYEGFELLGWAIYSDDKKIYTCDDSTLNYTIPVDSSITSLRVVPECRYYSMSNSLTNITHIDAMPLPGDDIMELWSYHSGNVNTDHSVWTGFPSIPLIVDDSVYVRANDDLLKLDIYSGQTLKSVTIPSTTVKAYYHYLGYGGGVIVDYAAEKAYDLNLNELYDLKYPFKAVFYNDGYFYGTYDNKLWKFDAESGELCNNENWLNGVSISWHSLYGTTSSPLFLGDKIYYVEINGDFRLIGSISISNGAKDSIKLTSLNKLLIDDGWLTHYQCDGKDYLFVTAYHAGLFESSTQGSTIAFVEVDETGNFVKTSEKYIQIPTVSGTASAFIVFNGRGYINISDTSGSKISGQFYVFDVDKLIQDVASNAWNKNNTFNKYLIYQEDSVSSHGSIVLNASQFDSTGQVYIYLLPYSSADQAVYIFTDSSEKTTAEKYFVTSKTGIVYGSQAVRVGSEGQLIWYVDSGRLYCYGEKSLNAYFFMVSDEVGTHWVKVTGSNSINEALTDLGFSIENGQVSYDGMIQKIYYYDKGWKESSQLLSIHDSFNYFIISSSADLSQEYYYYSDDQIKTCDTLDILSDKSLINMQLYTDIFNMDESYTVEGNSVIFKISVNKIIEDLDDSWIISLHVKYSDLSTISIQSPIILNDKSIDLSIKSTGTSSPVEYVISIWDKIPEYNSNATLYLHKSGYISSSEVGDQ